MKEIKLTKNMIALVDDEDFERTNKLKWCATINGKKIYAINNFAKRKYMHHFIYGEKILLDHIDGNGLNNCKSNLRPATKSQNGANRSAVGVFYNKLNKNWRSRIMCNGKTYEVGSFSSKEEAIVKYLEKKKELFGEFS